MANYYGNRHRERFTYKRVSWDNWQEHENYDYITDGSIELSTESDLVVTGSFSFEGYEIPDTNDLLRIYYSFTDDEGEHVEHALATLFTSYSNLQYTETTRGVMASGELEGSSVLTVLQQDKVGAPITIKRNANAIYEAQKIIIGHGLRVEYEPGSYVLNADHTFDAGTDYLEIVRWLCEISGYAYPYPDEYGIVQLKDYSELQHQEDTIVFRNDSHSIMYPELEEENDWQKTPNVYKLLYNVDNCCMIAEAVNESGSRASLDARGGRKQVEFEETGDLPANGNRLVNLMNKAEEGLKKLSADIEYVTMKHAWRPMYVYRPVTIDYSDRTWTGLVEDMTIQLQTAIETQTKIKRELYDTLEITKTGEYLRGDEDDD